MVRTRRSQEDIVPAAASSEVEDEGETEDNTIVVDTPPASQKSRKRKPVEDIGENDFEPPSSRSRKRRQVEDIGKEDFEPTPKKRKSLPMREKDEITPKAKTKVVVEIPIKNLGPLPLSQSTREGAVADSQAEDELSEVGDEAKAEVSASQESRFECVEDIPSSDPRDNESELEFESQEYPEPLLATVEVEVEGGESDVEEEKEEPTPKPANKQKRFDSAEPEEQIFSTASEVFVIPSDHSDSEDSDDEAPEAVPTQAAAKTARLKEQEAANAIKEQLTATRLKRIERESALLDI